MQQEYDIIDKYVYVLDKEHQRVEVPHYSGWWTSSLRRKELLDSGEWGI